jgi:PAS domain S-box-containing protein
MTDQIISQAALICVSIALLSMAMVLMKRRRQIRASCADETNGQEKRILLKHYEYLTGYATDIILLLDKELNIVAANARALSAYGYSREEILQLNIQDLRAPETPSQLEAAPHLVEEQGNLVFETSHRHKNHTTFPVEVSTRMIDIGGQRFYQSIIRDLGEQKQMEKVLRENEERFRTIAETSIDVIFDVDLAGTILYLSPSVETITGYSPAELIGRHFMTLMVEEDFPKLTDAFATVIGGKSVSHFEIMVKGKKGQIVEGEFHGVPKVKEGRIVGAIGIGRDISRRKKSEAVLRLYAQRLEVLRGIDQAVLAAQPPEAISRAALPGLRLVVPCRHASVIIFDEADQARVMAVSGEGTTRIGAHAQAALETMFSPVTIETLREGGIQRIDDLGSASALTEGERLLAAEEIKTYINLPLIGEGRLIGSLNLGSEAAAAFDAEQVGIAREVADQLAIAIQQSRLHERIRQHAADLERQITERRQVEEARMRITTAMEQTSDGVIIMDPDGTIRYTNAAMEKISGYTRSELVGMHRRSIWTDQTNNGIHRAVENCLRQGETWSGDITGTNRNGATYTLKATLSPVRDNAGIVVNSIVIVRDDTHELTLEKQLRQAQKMEAIGLLAGGIAHDFNNILSSIIGYSELAQQKLPPEPSPVSGYLEQVLKAGERARELVKQILTFSRQTEKERKPLQLSLIIKEALKLLRSSLPSTIEIRTGIRAKIDTVLADPTEIHQVLMNLCTNAAYAMREKGGILTVDLDDLAIRHPSASPHHDLKPGAYLVLMVSDTGVGIAAAHLDRIFEPFFTTKAPGEGTGMGLSVVYGIVKSIGGSIAAESRPGNGTTFRVYLPRVEHEAANHPQTVESLPRGTERILFIDDEAAIARFGREMLGYLGYRVVTETSSEVALNLFRTQPDAFDLVITDLTMPGMTGISLAQEIARIRPNIPIILCTGLGCDLQEDISIGTIREVLAKPITLKQFSTAIRKALDGGNSPG